MEAAPSEHSKFMPLVMFDGPDGVGKSTQIKLTAQALAGRGVKTYVTRLSGGTKIGEQLRKISLNPSLKRTARTDLYIVLAMYNALSEELKVKRSEGYVCLVDRSPLSIIAYQVFGSGLSMNVGEAYVREAIAMFDPDVIISYDAPEEVIMHHLAKRAGKKNLDFFEGQSDEFNRRVLQGYAEANDLFSVSVINADADKKTVHLRTMAAIDPFIAG